MPIPQGEDGAKPSVVIWPYKDIDDDLVFVAQLHGTPAALQIPDAFAPDGPYGEEGPGYWTYEQPYEALDSEDEVARGTGEARPWVREPGWRRKRIEEITEDYFLITCAGTKGRPHKEKIIAAFMPAEPGAPVEFGGFLTDSELGQPAHALREQRPAGRHGLALKFRFRCSRCPRDEQVHAERLQIVYSSLREARDAGEDGASGPNGCVRLALSALPSGRYTGGRTAL
jgi:hypothetical protein